MNYEEVESFVGILRDNPGLTEIEVRSGSRALRLRRAPATLSRSGHREPGHSPAGFQILTPSHELAGSTDNGISAGSGDGGVESVAAASSNASAALRQIESTMATLPGIRVTAQLVGVFRAQRKSELSIGSDVEEEQSLGQIEAMRLLNDCPSPITGRITAILVEDGEPVEFGQPLFELIAVEPAA